MVILDTDHLSLAFWGRGADAEILRRRIATLPPEEVFATIVSYEEQTRVWLTYSSKAKTVVQQVEAYHRLEKHLQNFKTIPLVGFTAAAAVEFQRLRRVRVRIATMDLRIAAIGLTLGAMILTRNASDFAKVPGLKWEDWTKP